MLTTRSVISIISIATMFLGAGVVSGQNFPTKPIRIVTGGIGTANDFLARLVSKELADVWGKPVIVDNRATGITDIETVSKAVPDGHTLLVIGNSLWNVSLTQKVPYDPVQDFSPVSQAITSPSVLVVTPSLPVKSVGELIAMAKAKPGVLNYGSGAPGSSTHLSSELFRSMAGINIFHIQFKSVGQSIPSLFTGEVHMVIASLALFSPHMASGKVRALAVTSAQPSALAPGLPTIAASGVPGYQVEQLLNIFAPAKTPETIVNLLNREIVRVLNRADVKEKLFSSGVETVGSSPQQLASTMKSEIARMGKIIKDAGIRSD